MLAREKRSGFATSHQDNDELAVRSVVAEILPVPVINPLTPPIRLISIEGVCAILGLKRSATLRMVAEGKLPPPIKFGTSRRAAARWIEAEIIDFVMGKAAERRFVSPRPVSQRGAT